MVTRLLVPLDGSLLAEAALPVTNQLAHKLDVPVTLVHLLERNAPQQVHGDRHLSDPVEAERYLCDVRRRMSSTDPQVGHHVHRRQINNVSQAIVEHAIEMSSDLIVMGGPACVLCFSVALLSRSQPRASLRFSPCAPGQLAWPRFWVLNHFCFA
jgi:nucleotide-binding universal stress UspA family protein